KATALPTIPPPTITTSALSTCRSSRGHTPRIQHAIFPSAERQGNWDPGLPVTSFGSQRDAGQELVDYYRWRLLCSSRVHQQARGLHSGSEITRVGARSVLGRRDRIGQRAPLLRSSVRQAPPKARTKLPEARDSLNREATACFRD